MNKDFIYTAIVGKRLDDAFNAIEFCHHIFNDGSPENIHTMQMIDTTLDAITTLKGMIANSQNQKTPIPTADVEKEIADIVNQEPKAKGLRRRM